MILLIVAVIVAVIVGLFVIPWVGLVGVIPLVLVVLLAGWAALALVTGTTPSRAVWRTRRPTLLGPGGPDDPRSDDERRGEQ